LWQSGKNGSHDAQIRAFEKASKKTKGSDWGKKRFQAGEYMGIPTILRVKQHKKGFGGKAEGGGGFNKVLVPNARHRICSFSMGGESTDGIFKGRHKEGTGGGVLT